MERDRYVGSGGFNPASLGAAVTISGAMIGALLFSSPVVEIFHPRKPTIIRFIPLPDPPPPDPKPQPQVKQVTPQPQPVAPKPIVEHPIADPDPIVTVDKSDPIGPLTTGTGDVRVVVDPPPPPLPVLIDARPDPRFAADFQPDYPPSERRAEHEGRVVVRVLIGVDGHVQQVEAVSATSDAFLDATRRRALARWRFRPATRGGVPEASWRTMTVRFVLDGSE